MAIVTYSRDIDMMILSHREHINQLVESVRSTTQVALALKDQNLPDKVAEMKELVMGYAEMQQSLQDLITVLTQIKSREHRETPAPEWLETRLAEIKAQRGEVNLERSDFVRSFIEQLGGEEVADEDLEEDQVVLRGEISTMCPITRELLVNPVKSTCGHVYSQEAISALIRNSGRKQSVKCPFAGCRAVVTAKSLSRAPEVEQKLREETKRRATQTQDDDDAVEL